MTWQFSQSSDEEGLRLMVAFLQITDPLVRAALIEAAEHAASQATPSIVNENILRQDNTSFDLGAFASPLHSRPQKLCDDANSE